LGIGRPADDYQRLTALRAFGAVEHSEVICHRCTPCDLRHFSGGVVRLGGREHEQNAGHFTRFHPTARQSDGAD
jgi:hypothetical protein